MSLGSSGSDSSLSTTAARRPLSGIQEVAVAQQKLNELFQLWFSLPETEALLHGIVNDIKAGRNVDLPPPAATPISPSACPSTFSSPSQQIAPGPVRAPPLSPSRARSEVHQSPSPPHVFTFDDQSSQSPQQEGIAGAFSRRREGAPSPHRSARALFPSDTSEGNDSPGSRSPSHPEPEDEAVQAFVGLEDAHGSAGRGRKSSPSPSSLRKLSLTSSPSASPSSSSRRATGPALVASPGAGPNRDVPSVAEGTARIGTIPRFFRPRREPRNAPKRIPGESLSERLPVILEVWRKHNVEAYHGPDATLPAAAELQGGETIAIGDVQVRKADVRRGLPVEQFAAVAKTLCGFPSFFAAPLFRRIRRQFGGPMPAQEEGGEGEGDDEQYEDLRLPAVREEQDAADEEEAEQLTQFQGYDPETRGVLRLGTFLQYWDAEMAPFDHVDRFFRLLAKLKPLASGPCQGLRAIEPSDFMPFLEELLAFHPGLAFLESTPEFQEKYARTVVARIYYHLDPLASQALLPRQVRDSQPNLLQAFHNVDMEEDINLVNEYFSYEHFYVLYCKFWELDGDHDFLLTRADLNKMQDLTHAVLDRVFAGAGRPSVAGVPDRMGYEDFVCCLLSEEDKTHPISLKYWFRVVDVDGDGVITRHDMEYFYREQHDRMQELGLEPVKLDDLITQMMDLLCTGEPGVFRLEHFLHPNRIKLTGVFFSALFNLTKFQAFEAREPVLVKQELNMQGISQWDRFASMEYMRLAEEEEHDDVVGAVGSPERDVEGWSTFGPGGADDFDGLQSAVQDE